METKKERTLKLHIADLDEGHNQSNLNSVRLQTDSTSVDLVNSDCDLGVITAPTYLLCALLYAPDEMSCLLGDLLLNLKGISHFLYSLCCDVMTGIEFQTYLIGWGMGRGHCQICLFWCAAPTCGLLFLTVWVKLHMRGLQKVILWVLLVIFSKGANGGPTAGLLSYSSSPHLWWSVYW